MAAIFRQFPRNVERDARIDGDLIVTTYRGEIATVTPPIHVKGN